MSEKLSKEEYAKKMKEKRNEIQNKTNQEALLIGRSQERFLSFLDLYSRLNYTFKNTLLIHASCPNATVIKDFARWKEEGYHVKPKESGIQIIEPDGTFIRKDGSTAVKYRIKTVFDVSQTNAEPLENHYDLKDVRDALIFENEEEYEGMSLSDCIDHAVRKEAGDVNDEFVISCAEYILKKRYDVFPQVFDQDVAAYFDNAEDPKVVRGVLIEVERIYRKIRNRIERGLYIKEQEVSEYDE